MKDWIVKMFQEHRWACLCVLGALIVGIMILALGFWQTVLLLVLVGAAGGMGYLLDKGGWPEVSRFFSQLFGKKE